MAGYGVGARDGLGRLGILRVNARSFAGKAGVGVPGAGHDNGGSRF
jgi:hypothetical protein